MAKTNLKAVGRDIALGLSLANLCFLRSWSALVFCGTKQRFLMQDRPSVAQIAALCAAAGVVSVAAAVAFGAIRCASNRLARAAGGAAVFSMMLIAANAVRSLTLHAVPGMKQSLISIAGEFQWLIVHFCLAAAFLIGSLLYPGRVVRIARLVLALLLPLVPLTIGRAVWAMAGTGRTSRPTAVQAAEAAPRSSPPRAIWILFDEWDYRLTFEKRSAGLQLPELDRFRSEALEVVGAVSPAMSTIVSVPALLVGRTISNARPTAPDEMLLEVDPGHSTLLSRTKTVFRAARMLGARTAAAGWYLPYCRLFAGDLDACEWCEISTEHNSIGTRFEDLFRNQLLIPLETGGMSPVAERATALHHRRQYSTVLTAGRRFVADRSLDLVYLHFPVPHAPFIWDRQNGRFRTKGKEAALYVDNLVLVDRALGELRRSMEQNGVWEETTVLLSSDHAYRRSPELDGVAERRVPFLLKLAGRSSRMLLRSEFNTSRSAGLLLAILRGELVSAEDFANWLSSGKGE
ncbi:MAG: sulfatase-like hydrolase/transferase [Acidobacteria bacterium]|nr:sulfatase-like hydrolase/transferase [Acidobacteriota bacterium]